MTGLAGDERFELEMKIERRREGIIFTIPQLHLFDSKEGAGKQHQRRWKVPKGCPKMTGLAGDERFELEMKIERRRE